MPFRDYHCPNCLEIKENVLGKCIPEDVICTECGHIMLITPAVFGVGPSSDTLKYRERKARFDNRNRRIEKMAPKQQEQFKKIIDSRNGQRYIP